MGPNLFSKFFPIQFKSFLSSQTYFSAFIRKPKPVFYVFLIIVFYIIPAPKRGLQFVFQSSGSPSKPLCFTAFQLPWRVCSSSLQVRAPLQNHCVLQHPSSQGSSAIRLSRFRPSFKTIVFYGLPATRHALQFVFPSSGPPSKPLCFTASQLPRRISRSPFQVRAPSQDHICFTAFQFPRRVCSSSFQVRAPLRNLCVLQHSSSLGGAAASLSKFGLPFKIIMFYIIPAPKDGLQLVFPSSGPSSKPLYFTAFRLPERTCSSSFQVRAPLRNHCV